MKLGTAILQFSTVPLIKHCWKRAPATTRTITVSSRLYSLFYQCLTTVYSDFKSESCTMNLLKLVSPQSIDDMVEFARAKVGELF